MNAIFGKELKSYFTGITGYIFTAAILIVTGIYTMIYCLSYQYAVFEYVYASISFIYLIAVPILTMRMFPEERKQKTDQLLYSLPIKMSDIVLGKYFAALVVLAIPTAVTCIYPIILSLFGTFNFKIVFSTMLCFYLLGAALIAVCMFISSLTENQILAAIFSFIVVFIAYFLQNISSYISSSSTISFIVFILLIALVVIITKILTKNKVLARIIGIVIAVGAIAIMAITSTSFDTITSAALEKLSIFEGLYSVIYGSLDIKYLLELLSCVVLFNFFTVQVLEKRRWA